MSKPSCQGSALFPCAESGFDARRVREDFPALHQSIHGKPLIYFDNAASAQKPTQVLQAMDRFYRNDYANVHRGVHELSQRATDAFEQARKTVARFIGAAEDEIIFTRGATESLNLLACSWGRTFLKSGDEVLITELEHHANIVPWQMLAKEKGVVLKTIPITDDGDVLLAHVEKAITANTKLISVAHVSNALGTVLPVDGIIRLARAHGIPVALDGCQATPHHVINVRTLDCDFYAFSGHKLYGPTGIGVLYGKKKWLEQMPPYQTGGDMIASVSFKETSFREPPYRFEAGTPAITEAVGLAAAIDYISTLGLERIAAYEQELLQYATRQIAAIPSVQLIGTAPHKAAILSFTMEGVHPHDIGTVLDRYGIAVRAGHHCAQPLMERLGLPATTRASFAFYNTPAEVDALAAALRKVEEMFL